MIFELALALSSMAASTQALPPQKPTARELYIGCSLFVRDADIAQKAETSLQAFSAERCALTAFMALKYWRQITPGTDWEYCIPTTASISADRGKAIANAYLDFYEKYGRVKPEEDGLTIMLYGLKETWPC